MGMLGGREASAEPGNAARRGPRLAFPETGIAFGPLMFLAGNVYPESVPSK